MARKTRPPKGGKPIKYPAKFRATLEKMKTDREEAAAEADERAASREAFDRLTNTLLRELLKPNSVYLMHVNIDEERQRITMDHRLSPSRRRRVLSVPPPWLTRRLPADEA